MSSEPNPSLTTAGCQFSYPPARLHLPPGTASVVLDDIGERAEGFGVAGAQQRGLHGFGHQ